MAKKTLSLQRRIASVNMRMTNDIVIRANERTMASGRRFRRLSEASRTVSEDGTIEVSVRYSGKLYTQRITPLQLNSSFGKAISSHVKKI